MRTRLNCGDIIWSIYSYKEPFPLSRILECVSSLLLFLEAVLKLEKAGSTSVCVRRCF